MKTMIATYNTTMDKIWHDIHNILKEYLGETVTKRHHYIELKCLDERNIIEREDNEQRIAKTTVKNAIRDSLQEKHDEILNTNEKIINDLIDEQNELTAHFNRLRKELTLTNKRDEKQMVKMTTISNSVISDLEKIKSKGIDIKQMALCCRRLETEEEKLISWAVARKNYEKYEVFGDITSEISKEELKESGKDSGILEIYRNTPPKIIDDKYELAEGSEEYVINGKDEESESLYSYEILNKLEGMIWSYNRVEMNCIELKAEKSELMAENRRLKNVIRNILEEAVMEPTAPSNKYVRTKISSAPVSFKGSTTWKPRIPNCVVLEF